MYLHKLPSVEKSDTTFPWRGVLSSRAGGKGGWCQLIRRTITTPHRMRRVLPMA